MARWSCRARTCNTVVAGGVAIVSSDATWAAWPRSSASARRWACAPPAGASCCSTAAHRPRLAGAKVTPDGLLLAGVLTKMPVDAFRLHLEFRTPYMPAARGQARGNSGVYIQQRYEVQILDSFGLEGVENECGGLYRQTRPDVNMCLPPLAWQTYDIWFTPPQFAADGKTKTANARITVLHNGVPIHRHREITAKTGGGKAEGPRAASRSTCRTTATRSCSATSGSCPAKATGSHCSRQLRTQPLRRLGHRRCGCEWLRAADDKSAD